MKTLIVELDDDSAEQLERIAPGKSRQRSEFIRSAIRKALWEIEEHATAEAYGQQPDSASDVLIDPGLWEVSGNKSKARPRASRKKAR
jgi:hypothetical protein